MDFSQALAFLKTGSVVRRQGWNRQGMFVTLQRPDEHSKMTAPYCYITVPVLEDGETEKRIPWLPGNCDLMADDWDVI